MKEKTVGDLMRELENFSPDMFWTGLGDGSIAICPDKNYSEAVGYIESYITEEGNQ